MSDREEMELLELSFTHFGNGYPRSKYRRIWPLVPSFHLPARKHTTDALVRRQKELSTQNCLVT